MILIGIGGSSAVGKTTASEYIRSKVPAAVIHMDFVLNDFKKRYFPDNINVVEAHRGEGEIVAIKQLPMKPKRGSAAYRGFLYLKAQFISWEVQKRIKQFEAEGYEIVIVEGRSLDCLSIDFTFAIHIDSSLHNRVLRHQMWDSSINRDMVIDWDISDADRYFNAIVAYNYGICNNQDLESFKASLDKILLERFPDLAVVEKKLVP